MSSCIGQTYVELEALLVAKQASGAIPAGDVSSTIRRMISVGIIKECSRHKGQLIMNWRQQKKGLQLLSEGLTALGIVSS